MACLEQLPLISNHCFKSCLQLQEKGLIPIQVWSSDPSSNPDLQEQTGSWFWTIQISEHWTAGNSTHGSDTENRVISS